MRKFVFILLFAILFIPSYVAKSQTVDLLWQGDVYTPPFYEGKSLWSKQARITFVAIPQGLGNPNSLNYKWTKNGTVLGSISGMGKNSLSFNDTIFSKPQTVKVEIVGNDNQPITSATETLVPTSPEVLVYEDNPLYGLMFNHEVGDKYKFNEKETSFSAFPLFFSVSNYTDDNLTYSWQTNSGVKEPARSITFRAPDESTGNSQIGISISNNLEIVQRVSKSFLVEF